MTNIIRICSDCKHAVGFHYPSGCWERASNVQNADGNYTYCECNHDDVYFFQHLTAWHYGSVQESEPR